MGYLYGAPVLIYPYEGYYLIEGAFGIELHLRMLVCDAERLNGGLAGMGGAAVSVYSLAKGLCPELCEPVSHILKRIGIGHHDVYVAALFNCLHLQCSHHVGGIMPYVVRAAQLIHIGGAGKELLDIYAAYRGGQEAHGTKLAEPSAYSIRHIECIEAEFL